MKNEALLSRGLKEIGIDCTKTQIDAFACYLTELKKWNSAYNLTALKNDEDIIIKHFLDSLLYIRAIPEGAKKIADIGTGAGFPGLPIKIVRPGIDLTLIETSKKKAAFLRHMLRRLSLADVTVEERRVHTIKREREGVYDIVVSRATFDIEEFYALACPCVKDEGRLVLSKGPKALDELTGSGIDNAIKNAIKEIHMLRLPMSQAERNLFVMVCGKK